MIAIPFTTVSSANGSLLSNNVIELKNSTYSTYGQSNGQLVLKSKKGNINLDTEAINLIGEVEVKFILDGKNFRLKTESLDGNLSDKSISSKERVLFTTENIEITSTSMQISITEPDEAKIQFRYATLGKINSKSNTNKGKANTIEFFPAKNLIFMKGDAELYEQNMKISSDEIYYDLNEDRILKSVNSKIINNL